MKKLPVLDYDPSLRPDRKARAVRTGLRVVATAGALLLAACASSSGANPDNIASSGPKDRTELDKPIDSTTSTTHRQTTTTRRETTTTALSTELAANNHNHEVTSKIEASLKDVVADWPERIVEFGKRHSYSAVITETGAPGSATEVDYTNDLRILKAGAEKNLLVQPAGNREAGDPTVEFSFLLVWKMGEDGSRNFQGVHVFSGDHTDKTTFADPAKKGFRPIDVLSLSRAQSGGFSVEYYGGTADSTNGQNDTGLVGVATTINPDVVSQKLAQFDQVLDQ